MKESPLAGEPDLSLSSPHRAGRWRRPDLQREDGASDKNPLLSTYSGDSRKSMVLFRNQILRLRS
jgi:hypothetical protein